MAYANVNYQGIVDSMVTNMFKSESDKKMDLVIESKFDEIIDARIIHHTEQIKELKAQADGSNINSAAINYHERRLARYMQ